MKIEIDDEQFARGIKAEKSIGEKDGALSSGVVTEFHTLFSNPYATIWFCNI